MTNTEEKIKFYRNVLESKAIPSSAFYKYKNNWFAGYAYGLNTDREKAKNILTYKDISKADVDCQFELAKDMTFGAEMLAMADFYYLKQYDNFAQYSEKMTLLAEMLSALIVRRMNERIFQKDDEEKVVVKIDRRGNNNRGKHWCHNPDTGEIIMAREEEMPNGFVKGRGMHFYKNIDTGEKKEFQDEKVPEGWVRSYPNRNEDKEDEIDKMLSDL